MSSALRCVRSRWSWFLTCARASLGDCIRGFNVWTGHSCVLTGGRAFGASRTAPTHASLRNGILHFAIKKWLNFHHFWAILAQNLPKLEKRRAASFCHSPCQLETGHFKGILRHSWSIPAPGQKLSKTFIFGAKPHWYRLLSGPYGGCLKDAANHFALLRADTFRE